MSTFSNLKGHAHSQLFVTLPVPTAKFTDQVIIVTGANTGLGLEAARHLVRLDAAKVILAVRSLPKGEAAAKSIAESTGREGVAEAWELDMARYGSVEAFARRAIATLPRVDVLIANAGVFLFDFGLAESGDEETVVVNVISPMLLALLLLPKMRETAATARAGKPAVMTFTGSFTHWMTEFPERKNKRIFEQLADPGKARMGDRYYVSKLVQLLVVREFAAALLSKPAKPGRVIASVLNPGFVRTEIMRHGGLLFRVYVKTMHKVFARGTEEGSRTLVHAAEGAEETHGQYLDDCKVGRPSAFVLSPEGDQTQKQLWRELLEKLERIHPGLTQNL